MATWPNIQPAINWLNSYKWIIIAAVVLIGLYLFSRKRGKSNLPMMTKEEAFKLLAKEFGITPAHICAVSKIESSSGGYLEDGRPTLLFEGHVFWKELKKRGKNPQDYLPAYGDVLNEKWDKSKYGKSGAGQYPRLARAEELCKKIGLDNTAALNAAGWGMFGIQGFSADRAGYSSAQAMVKDFRENPNRVYVNVRAFLNFCKSKSVKGENLIEKLKKQDWAGFAYGYNGAGYAKNKYDTKLAAAFEKCKQSIQ